MFQANVKKITRIIWLQVAIFTILLSIFRQIFTFSVGDISAISQVIPDYIQSIYIIMKELYSNNSLPKEYNDILNNLLTKEEHRKCKFKIMDIIERK